jgi:hypothetical protein
MGYEKKLDGRLSEERFGGSRFGNLRGLREYPPSPPPSERLDWRGFCKRYLHNIEGVRVRGKKLESKKEVTASLGSPL